MKWPRIKLVWGDDAAETTRQAPNVAEPDAVERSQPKPAIWKRLLGWDKQAERPRPFLVRLFAIRLGGAVNLLIWCVVVGAVMRLAQFNPFAPDFNAAETAGGVWSQAWAAAGWLVKMGWRPALTGAAIVLPIWFGWRVVTLPFRR